MRAGERKLIASRPQVADQKLFSKIIVGAWSPVGGDELMVEKAKCTWKTVDHRERVQVLHLQHELGKQEHEKTMAAYAKEEKEIREENLRLQRRLQLEMERREALCRHLSESESR